MNVSSSSLFRFTTKFEYLKDIVETGFPFRKCVEDMAIGSYPNDVFSQIGAVVDQLHSWAICFCDLPLSQTRDHRGQYGNYAIAMSKEWAMSRHVTPIRYYHSQSPDQTDSQTRLMIDMLVEAGRNPNGVMGALMHFLADHGASPTKEELESLPKSIQALLVAFNDFSLGCLEHYWKTFQFTRLYEGKWTDRINQNTTTRRFYDEREWRAVTHKPDQRLGFKFSDIRHIIVISEEECRELGATIIQSGEKLGVTDEASIWQRIQIADKIYEDA